MAQYENICRDIGILVSTDPVAVDSASLDIVEKTSGKAFSKLAYDIPYKFQIEYAEELGFCSAKYEIIEVS